MPLHYKNCVNSTYGHGLAQRSPRVTATMVCLAIPMGKVVLWEVLSDSADILRTGVLSPLELHQFLATIRTFVPISLCGQPLDDPCVAFPAIVFAEAEG